MSDQSFDLTGKLLLVTGAGTGIGRGIALAAAQAGADIVLHYASSAAGAQSAVAEIIAMGRRALENRATLTRFLGEPFVATLPTTAEVARRYGQIFAKLRQAGTPIPTNDMWIAAATIDAGAQLLTFDIHFRQVPGLDSTLLDAGPGAGEGR